MPPAVASTGFPGRAAAGPGEAEVEESLVHLVDVEEEDVVRLLEETLVDEDLADLAHLVEEERGAPVLDEELVPFRVGKDVAAEPEHLVELHALLIGRQ